MIEFTCQACGQRYRLPQEMAGKRGKCRKCQKPMTIPEPARPDLVHELFDESDTTLAVDTPKLPPRAGASHAKPAKSPRAGWILPTSLLGGVAALAVLAVLIRSLTGPARTTPTVREAPAKDLADLPSLTVENVSTQPTQDSTAKFPKPPTNLESVQDLPEAVVDIPEVLQPDIDGLIAALKANPDGFDYQTHHHLRDRFFKAGDLRRMAHLCEAILAHVPYDEYTLGCMGAFPFNGPKIPQELARWFDFPEYRRVQAACRLKTAEVINDPEPEEALLAEVERMEGDELAPYRELVPRIRAQLAETAPQRLARKHAQQAAEEASRAAYNRFLDELRHSGQDQAAQRIQQRVDELSERIKPVADRANLIVGRVILEGPGRVGDVQAQMRIGDDGYFVSDIGEIGKPVGFRLEGYQPFDLATRGEPGEIVLVGEIRLKPLPASARARLKGRIQLEGQNQVRGAIGHLYLKTGPINTTGGYEGERGLPGPPVPISPGGEFTATELTPSEYMLYFEAPGYWPEPVTIPMKPGQETDGDLVKLSLAEKLRVSYVLAPDTGATPFQGLSAKSAEFIGPEGFSVGDQVYPGRNLRLTRHEGKVWISSIFGPFLVHDLGVGKVADFLGMDVREVGPGKHDTAPQVGHVYLGTWDYPKRLRVLFSIDSIEKITPEQAMKSAR